MQTMTPNPMQTFDWLSDPVDPSPITVRELSADDDTQVIDLFEKLSDFDRYLRFFRPMPTYPSSILTFLTGADGDGHVAVGAFRDGACVGVIRYVRSSRRPSTAEVAVTVSGEHRGLGIARRLMESLTELALARGVEEFEIDVLPSNRVATALFRSLGFAMRFDSGSIVGTRAVRQEASTRSRGLLAA